nr:MAG TPA: hypothetical protein [Caudoviricetes sp.]
MSEKKENLYRLCCSEFPLNGLWLSTQEIVMYGRAGNSMSQRMILIIPMLELQRRQIIPLLLLERQKAVNIYLLLLHTRRRITVKTLLHTMAVYGKYVQPFLRKLQSAFTICRLAKLSISAVLQSNSHCLVREIRQNNFYDLK